MASRKLMSGAICELLCDGNKEAYPVQVANGVTISICGPYTWPVVIADVHPQSPGTGLAKATVQFLCWTKADGKPESRKILCRHLRVPQLPGPPPAGGWLPGTQVEVALQTFPVHGGGADMPAMYVWVPGVIVPLNPAAPAGSITCSLPTCLPADITINIQPSSVRCSTQRESFATYQLTVNGDKLTNPTIEQMAETVYTFVNVTKLQQLCARSEREYLGRCPHHERGLRQYGTLLFNSAEIPPHTAIVSYRWSRSPIAWQCLKRHPDVDHAPPFDEEQLRDLWDIVAQMQGQGVMVEWLWLDWLSVAQESDGTSIQDIIASQVLYRTIPICILLPSYVPVKSTDKYTFDLLSHAIEKLKSTICDTPAAVEVDAWNTFLASNPVWATMIISLDVFARAWPLAERLMRTYMDGRGPHCLVAAPRVIELLRKALPLIRRVVESPDGCGLVWVDRCKLKSTLDYFSDHIEPLLPNINIGLASCNYRYGSMGQSMNICLLDYVPKGASVGAYAWSQMHVVLAVAGGLGIILNADATDSKMEFLRLARLFSRMCVEILEKGCIGNSNSLSYLTSVTFGKWLHVDANCWADFRIPKMIRQVCSEYPSERLGMSVVTVGSQSTANTWPLCLDAPVPALDAPPPCFSLATLCRSTDDLRHGLRELYGALMLFSDALTWDPATARADLVKANPAYPAGSALSRPCTQHVHSFTIGQAGANFDATVLQNRLPPWDVISHVFNGGSPPVEQFGWVEGWVSDELRLANNDLARNPCELWAVVCPDAFLARITFSTQAEAEAALRTQYAHDPGFAIIAPHTGGNNTPSWAIVRRCPQLTLYTLNETAAPRSARVLFRFRCLQGSYPALHRHLGVLALPLMHWTLSDDPARIRQRVEWPLTYHSHDESPLRDGTPAAGGVTCHCGAVFNP